MIKYWTSNGTYLSIPGSAPGDLALARELIPMSIEHEAGILAAKAGQLCDVLRRVAAQKEDRDG